MSVKQSRERENEQVGRSLTILTLTECFGRLLPEERAEDEAEEDSHRETRDEKTLIARVDYRLPPDLQRMRVRAVRPQAQQRPRLFIR